MADNTKTDSGVFYGAWMPGDEQERAAYERKQARERTQQDERTEMTNDA